MFVVIGIPDHKRVQLFVAAAQRLGRACRVIDWRDVLHSAGAGAKRGDAFWTQNVPEGATVRIESPGQCFPVELLLLELGAAEPETDVGPAGKNALASYRRITCEEVRGLAFDRGAVLPMRQWYLGWRRALRYVAESLEERSVRWMNPPDDIEQMFDKAACHKRMMMQELPVPSTLGIPGGFDDLIERMQARSMHRLFLKPCHGSSASGVIALQMGGGGQIRAECPVEMVEDGAGELRLYNSRKVKLLRDVAEIRRLVDFVCRERAHTERWMPKAMLDGMALDLRLVVIGGKASHVAVRMSRHPMTNLHLGAQRGDVRRLREVVGEPAWRRCLDAAEQTMARAFPQCHYAGLDVMMTTGARRPYVLEVNAFGDLMPNLPGLEQADDTYTHELSAWAESH